MTEFESFDWKDESGMSGEGLDKFQISTPKFKFLVVGTGDEDSSWVHIWDFSNDIWMSVLYSFDFITVVPVP